MSVGSFEVRSCAVAYLSSAGSITYEYHGILRLLWVGMGWGG